MTNPISGTAGGVAPPAATTTVDRADQMGKDTFLKLLVAQMRFQDPSNPTSSAEFMAQTATFSQVEKLEEIAAQNAALLTMQRAMSAGALVGHTVSYLGEDAEIRTGVVSSVVLAGADRGSESVAVVDGVSVPMGRMTAVSLPTAPPSTDGAGNPTTTS